MKHEAFAVRKSSGLAMPAEHPLDGEEDHTAWTDQRAERYERLRVGAEAMAGLKPQEIRCLLLKAEGLSYQEICDVTGFSYTKVNRCLTEGRRTFLKRVAGIEAGAECERLAPVISKVADGEASPEEMRLVRPHLKGCLACKATLREYRATPARLAGLVPPVVALGGGGPGFFARLLDRFAGMGDAAGAKVAAVAAAGVMLAGGGAAGVEAMHHDAPAVAPSAFSDGHPSVAAGAAADPAGASPAPASGAPDPNTAGAVAIANPATGPAPRPALDESAGDPLPEFDPGATSATQPASANAPASAQAPASTNGQAPANATAPASGSAPRTSAGSGAGEFGP